jgi:heat shock protein HslJ
MSNLRALLAAAILPVILFGGCSSAAAAPLEGRTFLSTRVTENGVDRPLVPGTSIRLTFNKDGQLGVNAGCNHMGGSYRIEGGTLRFEGGAMTEMGCDEPRFKQDDWLFGLLAARPTVALTGNELAITAGDVVIWLLDREIADPDMPLVGPTWTVISLITGDAVSSIPDGVVATLTFGADGRVEIQTGCNQGGGSYGIDGARIQFGDIVTTKRACDGASGQMETAVLAVLRMEGLGYSIDAGSLTIQGTGQGLMLAGGPNPAR